MTRETDDRLVTEALRSVGLEVCSVFDLMKWRRAYPEAVECLIWHLPRVEDEGVKEGIVRALTAKEARGHAAAALIAEFRRAPMSRSTEIGLKWAIANALAIVATEDDYPEIASLVKDTRHGSAREMLAVAIGNLKKPEGVGVLLGLLDDGDLVGHALAALGKMKATVPRSAIERFLTHPQAWVRKEAQKVLARAY